MKRLIKVKPCEHCHKEYQPVSNRQRYCGSKKNKIGCSFLMYSKYMKDWSVGRGKEVMKKWRNKNLDKVHINQWKWSIKRFGITLEGYYKIYELQGGRCAICRRHKDNFARRLSIDHNHKTGKVRGLLCASCNTLLGCVGDSIEMLEKAKKYLQNQEMQIKILTEMLEKNEG